jgi:cell shape-determining protein MreD
VTRILLRAWNAPGLVLFAAIAVAVETSLFPGNSLRFFQPDLLIFLVIWCSLKRDFTEGGLLVLIFANIAELHSSAPQGLYLLVYMLLYLLIRFFNKVLIIWSLFPLTLGVTAGSKLLIWIVLRSLDVGDGLWKHMALFLFPSLFVQGLLSHTLYRWLRIYDRATYKDLSAIQAAESGLQPDEEGL